MTHVAILETDRLPEQVKQQFGSYADMFQHLLLSGDNSLRFSVFDVEQGNYPKAQDPYDCYLITGSKADAYSDLDWIVQLRQFIRQLFHDGKKIIGVCFGHQIIAHSLGGKTEKSLKGWGVGNHAANMISSATWIPSDAKNITLLYSHQDQVTQLPPAAPLIAGNNFCPNAMYSIHQQVFCMQGHPEFLQDYSRYLMEVCRDNIGEETVRQGLESLTLTNDSAKVRDWMLRFIETESSHHSSSNP